MSLQCKVDILGMTLYIDTADFNKVTFSLEDSHQGKIPRGQPSGGFRKTYKVEPHQSNEIIAKLEEFLTLSFDRVIPSDDGVKSKILNPKSLITRIVVNKGPGSFTGVRIGVTIAQALGLAWNVPVKPTTDTQMKKMISQI